MDRVGAINAETAALENAFNQQEQVLRERLRRLQEFEQYRRSLYPRGALSKQAGDQTLLESFRRGENADILSLLPQNIQDVVNGRSEFSRNTFSGLRDLITHQLPGQINAALFDIRDEVRQNLYNQLASIFNDIPADTIIRSNLTTRFRETIQRELVNLEIDKSTRDSLLNSIKGGIPIDQVFSNFSQAITQAQQDLANSNQKNGDQLTETQQKLQLITQAAEEFKRVNLGEVFKQNITTQINESKQGLENFYNEIKKAPMDDIGNKARGGLDQANNLLTIYNQNLQQIMGLERGLGNIQNIVQRWMGFYQIINLTRRAINSMKKHIQELDAVMTKIAVVTNMTQEDLWNKISEYSKIAQQYGVAIKGVYEVSQIFYQQGLQTNEVMELTTETLKMAKLAGLDYSTAADYMTTAIRGFKLEMSDAAHVTDVWSSLAAKTASNTQELAIAISKVASSAESVGSSFEATSAMMATMISVTRESATNIGTALKSVIARYGEMKADPSKLVDSEGEELSLNKVDTALQAVGISLHTVNGEFRDFDDVILELGKKWNSLDSSMQRYY